MKAGISLISAMLVLVASWVLYESITDIFANRHAHSPVAVNGWIDLREHPLSGREAIRLDGEWEFIPGQLVAPADIHAVFPTPQFVKVPSVWTAYTIDNVPVNPYLSATYRLRIRVSEQDHELAIKTTNIRLANRLFINGKNMQQSGLPQEDETYRAYNVPYAKTFQVEEPVVDIVLHVANFHYSMGGGIISSIYLGSEKSIHAISQSAVSYDWIMVAVFLTIGIFGFGYYLQIGRDRKLLMFALFCFSIALYRLTHGERLLSSIMPAMSYELFQKIQFVSVTGMGIFLTLFYYVEFRELCNRYVIRLFLGMGAILTVILLWPAQLNTQLDSFYGYYILGVFGYTAYVSFAFALLRKSGSVYLILSCLSLMALFITEHLDITDGSTGIIHLHILPFVYLISMVLYLSHQFAKDYLRKERLNQQLVRHDRLKDEFLANTSHEFRTPLHGMISIAESMLHPDQPLPLNEEYKEKLQLISGVSRRLSGLVNDILEYTKLKQGEYTIKKKPFELYSTVQLAVAFCSHLTHKNVPIIHHVPDTPCWIIGDEERVRQILYNLIGNAAKFTKHGQIDISYSSGDAFIFIAIRDTGSGISPEELKVIFEPYQQGNAHVSGTGLGLSIVKQLVELQGGQITVESVAGEGSTFRFSLPNAEARIIPGQRATAVPSAPSAVAHALDEYAAAAHTGVAHRRDEIHISDWSTPRIIGNGDSAKVMIVDDDHLSLKMLIDILKTDHYTLIAVDSGKQALEQLARDPSISLVLLDIMMPDMSGYEVCSTIRRSRSLIELPILMLTAAILPEDIEAAFQSGANDFLHKPLEVAELRTRVRNLMMMKDTAAKATEMEISFLQAQVKPHFIYNVLNSVLSLSYSDLDNARKLLIDFSTFLRGSFVFATVNNRIPLHQELSLVKAYVEIEKARYPRQFEFKSSIDPELACMIPPLIVQPLVENAIRHGVKSNRPCCIIELTIMKNGPHVNIDVTDTGAGIPPDILDKLNNQRATAHGVGLHNIIKRIRQITEAHIQIHSELGKGTRIAIQIPEWKWHDSPGELAR